MPLACPCGVSPEKRPGKSEVGRDKCIGCAVCVTSCPEAAIMMEPVSEEEWFHAPSSMAEWEEMRLQNLATQKQLVGR
jgi:ferredoxin